MSDPLVHFPQISLRIAQDLHDQLTEAAKTAHRSLAEEVTARLEESFLHAPSGRNAPDHDRHALLERLKRLEDLVDQVEQDAQA